MASRCGVCGRFAKEPHDHRANPNSMAEMHRDFDERMKRIVETMLTLNV